jgi:molybdate transport system ATP-binding protein
VVLTGFAHPAAGASTLVELDGGGTVTALERGSGPVAVSVYPWEIVIEPAGEKPHGSAENRLPVEVVSVTTVGSRVRVGLGGAQPLVAEVTLGSAERLRLEPGARVIATWKAAATRLVGL